MSALGWVLVALICALAIAISVWRLRRINADNYNRLQAALADLSFVSNEAKLASEAKSNFLAVISHELRTPLTAIMGYIEIICLGVRGDISPEAKEDLARALKSSNHLLSLISGILDFIKLENGSLKIRSSAVSLVSLVSLSHDIVKPSLLAKDQRWEQDIPDLRVKGDSERIQQILLNLLSNASKFTPRNGLIKIKAWKHDRSVVIEVADTGIGISPDEVHVIFEPFVQLDSGMTRSYGGTGLGLTISREMARKMGGSLVCRSTLGVGSVFTLTLPSPVDLD